MVGLRQIPCPPAANACVRFSKDSWRQPRKERQPLCRHARDRLHEIASSGSNPGNLRMFTYAPPKLPAAPALVVALHGCHTDRQRLRSQLWVVRTLADAHGSVLWFAQ